MQETEETQLPFLSQEDPWRRKWQPALVFLPGKSHGQSSLVGYSSQGCKESDRTQKLSNNLRHWPLLLRQDFLEERAV